MAARRSWTSRDTPARYRDHLLLKGHWHSTAQHSTSQHTGAQHISSQHSTCFPWQLAACVQCMLLPTHTVSKALEHHAVGWTSRPGVARCYTQAGSLLSALTAV
jgi:hypothetical protein